MPLLPRAMRPAVLIRRKAIYSGILGSSTLWRAVAVVVLGRGTLKKVFGKHPQHLTTEKLEPGQFMQIAAIKPTTRRQRKRARSLSS